MGRRAGTGTAPTDQTLTALVLGLVVFARNAKAAGQAIRSRRHGGHATNVPGLDDE